MKVRFGERTMDYPSERLGELRDANSLLGDSERLRQRLEEDGRLLRTAQS